MDLCTKAARLRRAILDREFAGLNPMQRQAVFHTEGPLLILAGAGSGKTTVLINRIAALIRYGHAYESEEFPADLTEDDITLLQGVLGGKEGGARAARLLAVDPPAPWQILAITFTNKAAGELRDRLENILGEEGQDVWAATFHSTCARMLRRHADRLGYASNFSVYDADDSRRLMKECLRALNMDEKLFPVRSVLSEIGRAKDELLDPEAYAVKAGPDFRKKKIAEAYKMYEGRLRASDAMDFDDLLMQTVLLLERHDDVRADYRRRFRYILVDEYQDTNRAQYRFVTLLTGEKRNLCVVGDDDQSIYQFRGATIENILSFETQYPDARVIRLEQNYRSTDHILKAANAVIAHNSERKGKNLWTENGAGEPILHYRAQNEQDEARFVADTVLENVRKGMKFGDHAVLYRLNAQASSIERALVKSGVPYRILAGLRFYEHKEIKDVLAYLSVINNRNDSERLLRILNEPKRQIGDTTKRAAADIASQLGIPLFEVLRTADEYASLIRAATKLKAFAAMIEGFAGEAEEITLHALYEKVLDETGYWRMLREQGEEGVPRIENLNEFASTILTYEEENDEPSLSGFLEEISLMTDVDNYDRAADAVVLMTLHAAKGLEFPSVFIPGMEDGIFPGMQSIYNPGQVEEERRLAYVGITRAREVLYIISCESRMLYGTTTRNKLSRFVEEIPDELITRVHSPQLTPSAPPARSFAAEKRAAKAAETATARRVGTGSQPSRLPSLTYGVGDTVSHKVFGSGRVTAMTPMGNDCLVEILFDKVGVKKLMANFAPLKKMD